ncbi:ankyrin repeat-containing protein BDA1-like protein [Cinnamomum micranthum f. kanehirae]|uniref:Ankyrin repeat-containing protein BDA1-like protein n=1 Tax=Cinnamomum micranthum f. kanehirae TaxID=337451 RepID=A0A3S3NQ57_9MAGN|nr:ankyrin repeat-containing protein BDA1-like protein [Cinnamomum micranthum f. kanehirae]
MDGRLLEAAIRGNKQKLVELLQEDPLILDQAMEIRGNKQKLVELLDQAMDECTGKGEPSALGSSLRACRLSGMIPLHVAAIKGQVDVLEELVNAKSVTAFLLTDGGEPILHLCAKNNQFKALEKLVELVEDEDFVNLKDSEYNNISPSPFSQEGN